MNTFHTLLLSMPNHSKYTPSRVISLRLRKLSKMSHTHLPDKTQNAFVPLKSIDYVSRN
jgi:hypothetical protein